LPFPCEIYEVHAETLAPSTTLVFYTDGLVERRDRSLDAGLEELRNVVEASLGMSSDDLADALIRKLAPETVNRDDICVLVLRRRSSSRPTGVRNRGRDGLQEERT
jgi:serine phosphatase RsbU (regulator of sigma subunit)